MTYKKLNNTSLKKLKIRGGRKSMYKKFNKTNKNKYIYKNLFLQKGGTVTRENIDEFLKTILNIHESFEKLSNKTITKNEIMEKYKDDFFQKLKTTAENIDATLGSDFKSVVKEYLDIFNSLGDLDEIPKPNIDSDTLKMLNALQGFGKNDNALHNINTSWVDSDKSKEYVKSILQDGEKFISLKDYKIPDQNFNTKKLQTPFKDFISELHNFTKIVNNPSSATESSINRIFENLNTNEYVQTVRFFIKFINALDYDKYIKAKKDSLGVQQGGKFTQIGGNLENLKINLNVLKDLKDKITKLKEYTKDETNNVDSIKEKYVNDEIGSSILKVSEETSKFKLVVKSPDTLIKNDDSTTDNKLEKEQKKIAAAEVKSEAEMAKEAAAATKTAAKAKKDAAAAAKKAAGEEAKKAADATKAEAAAAKKAAAAEATAAKDAAATTKKAAAAEATAAKDAAATTKKAADAEAKAAKVKAAKEEAIRKAQDAAMNLTQKMNSMTSEKFKKLSIEDKQKNYDEVSRELKINKKILSKDIQEKANKILKEWNNDISKSIELNEGEKKIEKANKELNDFIMQTPGIKEKADQLSEKIKEYRQLTPGNIEKRAIELTRQNLLQQQLTQQEYKDNYKSEYKKQQKILDDGKKNLKKEIENIKKYNKLNESADKARINNVKILTDIKGVETVKQEIVRKGEEAKVNKEEAEEKKKKANQNIQELEPKIDIQEQKVGAIKKTIDSINTEVNTLEQERQKEDLNLLKETAAAVGAKPKFTNPFATSRKAAAKKALKAADKKLETAKQNQAEVSTLQQQPKQEKNLLEEKKEESILIKDKANNAIEENQEIQDAAKLQLADIEKIETRKKKSLSSRISKLNPFKRSGGNKTRRRKRIKN